MFQNMNSVLCREIFSEIARPACWLRASSFK